MEALEVALSSGVGVNPEEGLSIAALPVGIEEAPGEALPAPPALDVGKVVMDPPGGVGDTESVKKLLWEAQLVGVS